MKIAFLSDNYITGRTSLDPFRRQLLSRIAGKSSELLYLQANDYLHDSGEFLTARYENHVEKAIRDFKPDVVFSLNRSGLTAKVQSFFSGPLISWYIDNPNRFPPSLRGYAKNEKVFCATKYQQDWVRRDAGEAQISTGYLPFCTDETLFYPAPEPASSICDVSFVGTLWEPSHFSHLINEWVKTDQDRDWFSKGFRDYLSNYDSTFPADLAARFDFMEVDSPLRNFLDDFISARNRLNILSGLSDLDLEVYGTQTWLGHSLVFPFPLFDRISPEPLLEPMKLADLYRRSRVGLSIAHHQAQSGFPIRIFDILACGTPLVTDRHSELGELFEEGRMFLSYSSPQEASECVRRVLQDKQLAKTLSTSALAEVREKHTFAARVKDIFQDAPDAKLKRLVVVSEAFPGESFQSFPTFQNVLMEQKALRRPRKFSPAFGPAVKAYRASRHFSSFFGVGAKTVYLASKFALKGNAEQRQLLWGLGRRATVGNLNLLNSINSILRKKMEKP